MSRLCEICGAPIGDSEGICQSCGVCHVGLNAAEVVMVGNSRWGVIQIELPLESVGAASPLSALRTVWVALEASSFQRLAPTQLHLITPGRSSIELIGPYTNFRKVQNALNADWKATFLDRSPSEIDDLLSKIPSSS